MRATDYDRPSMFSMIPTTRLFSYLFIRSQLMGIGSFCPARFYHNYPNGAKGKANVCVKRLCAYASFRSAIIFLAWTLGTIPFSEDTLSGFVQEAPCILVIGNMAHVFMRESTSRGRSLGEEKESALYQFHPPLERTFSLTVHIACSPE